MKVDNAQSGGDEGLEELVEIEEYGAKNVKPPKAKTYRIRIDKKKFDIPKPQITGRELLGLAEKDATRCAIRQKLHGGQVKTVGPDELVDLTAAGVERFMTLCHDQTDG
jgi:hypothetical protein